MDLAEIKTNLAKSLGINFLPEEQQDALIEQIGELLQKRIMLRVVEELDEELSKEFEQLLESTEGQPDAEENVSAFLAEKIPNMQVIIDEEVAKVKEEVKKDVEALEGK